MLSRLPASGTIVRLMDAQGKNVVEVQMNAGGSMSIDLTPCAAGTYSVQLVDAEGAVIATRPLVVQR
jgi:hypothetical protein